MAYYLIPVKSIQQLPINPKTTVSQRPIYQFAKNYTTTITITITTNLYPVRLVCVGAAHIGPRGAICERNMLWARIATLRSVTSPAIIVYRVCISQPLLLTKVVELYWYRVAETSFWKPW